MSDRTDPPVDQPLRAEELRRRLASWSVDRLVDLVMDLAQSDWDLHVRVDRHVRAREDPAATARALWRAIDLTLLTGPVEWHAVSTFITGLDVALADVVAFGREHPADAMALLHHLLAGLPAVFDGFGGEDELACFCEELAERSVEVAARGGLPLRESLEPLLRAFVEDTYGHFEKIPDALARALTRVPGAARAELYGCAMQLAGDARSSLVAETLESFAAQTRA